MLKLLDKIEVTNKMKNSKYHTVESVPTLHTHGHGYHISGLIVSVLAVSAVDRDSSFCRVKSKTMKLVERHVYPRTVVLVR